MISTKAFSKLQRGECWEPAILLCIKRLQVTDAPESEKQALTLLLRVSSDLQFLILLMNVKSNDRLLELLRLDWSACQRFWENLDELMKDCEPFDEKW